VENIRQRERERERERERFEEAVLRFKPRHFH
jgi:hypothetical protein